MKWHGNLLYVRDVAASVAFYRDGLGLPLLSRPAPHMAMIGLGRGVIYLHADPQDAPDWLRKALESEHRGVGIILHIQVSNVNSLADTLIAKGIDISDGPVDAH